MALPVPSLRFRSKSKPRPAIQRGTIPADPALACYLDWCEDAAAVAEAYERWSDAWRADSAMWFTAYLAALEQEEVSARSYAEAVANGLE